MKPSVVRTTPLPAPAGMRPERVRRVTRGLATEGDTRSAAEMTTREEASSASASVVALMAAAALPARSYDGALAELDAHGALVGAAQHRQLQRIRARAVKRRVQLVHRLEWLAVHLDQQIASLQAGARRGR